MSVAWELLAGLPAWEITEIPRVSPVSSTGGHSGGEAPYAARVRRAQALAPASRKDSAVAFGWVREAARGPVRIIAAGAGVRPRGASSSGPSVPMSYPAGAVGRPLRPGGAADGFRAVPYWVPVAIMPDALLDPLPAGSVPEGDGPAIEDGFLRAWRDPFGYLVLAVPVGPARRAELLSAAVLEQLQAERHDTPRAQTAARRAKARHAEFRQAATTGLWDIRVLAGAGSPEAAVRAGALLAASLDLRGLPFGLAEQGDRAMPLPQLLGAPPGEDRAKGPGPVARDIFGMDYEPGRRPAWGAPPAPSGPSGGPVPGPQPGSWMSSAAAGGAPSVPGWPDPDPQFPCAASSELLAALAVPPAREVPGVRMVLQPGFDVTPETGDGDGPGGVSLGDVLDSARLPAGTLSVSRGSLNRHTFVCGATGSGKSQTVRHLLETATAGGIPWLVIEPAKAEYRLMAARLPGTSVITIRPGDPATVPAGINPLEPAAGPGGDRFPLQAHADLVRALFLAAFQAEEPFPQVLSAALTRCYTEAGWDLVSGESAVNGASFPALSDLQAAALAVVDEIGYGQEVRDNVRGFVSVRIGSLQAGTTGRFLSGAFPLDYGRLLSGNVVLEIEDCGDDTDKAFLTGAVLIRLTEHLRMRARAEGPGAGHSPDSAAGRSTDSTAGRGPDSASQGSAAVGGLRHLTVIEEAHRLLRQPPDGAGAGAAAHAVEMFAGLLAEIRAYGEGLVIAEQIPAKLIPDAIKNTAVKIVHRLPAKDDRDTVGATMNLTDEQSAFLVTLRPGEAAVFTDGMDYPVLAKLPDGSDRENTSDAAPASPTGLITSSRPSCPPSCAGQDACTLRQLSDSARTAADPRLTLWAELAVTAHLAGWTAPMPRATLARDLRGKDRRDRDCAVASAVETAVAARVPAFSARVAGPALAAHIAAAMRMLLDENRWLCQRIEPEWNAPSYLWGRILDELRLREDEHPGGGPHPSTAEWEDTAGVRIPGATCAEQIAIVQKRDADARNALSTADDILFGGRQPSAIERAVGGTRDDPAWYDKVAAATAVLGYCDWAPNELASRRTTA